MGRSGHRLSRAGWLRAALLVGAAALVFLPGSIDSPNLSDAVDRPDGEAAEAAGEEQVPDAVNQPVVPDPAPRSTNGQADDEPDEAFEAQGSIHELAEIVPEEVSEPVGVDETAEFGNGVRARLVSIEAIEAEARVPGEFSGPAVVLSVEITNESSDAIDLGTVTVDVTFDDGVPALTVTDPERAPLAGELTAGDAVTGHYVFTLAPDEREDVQVRINYSADTPTVVFAGSVADV